MIQISIQQKIGHFEVVERIGEGAMGEVFKAKDLNLGRFVALKALKPGIMAAATRERFFREARVASALNHPNIVTIFDAFTEDGTDFIAMELISGKTLGALIADRPLPRAEALDFAMQIAEALHAASRAGIVHRDLKPGNIMVTEDRVIKVLDFGLAKLEIPGQASFGDTATFATLDAGQTIPGTIMGTAAYMSPEQAEGKPVDARSDIFSFGAILYEMLTGKRPFEGESGMSTLIAVLTKEPKAPAELSPGIPEPLQFLVLRCLRKDIERRFQTAADLRAALHDVRDGVRGIGEPVLTPTSRSGFRSGWVWGAAAGAVIAVLLGMWFYLARNNAATDTSASVFPKATPFTAFRGNEANPTFSPNGTQIAFSWDGEGSDNSDIYVKVLGPGRPVRVTTDPRPDACPSWSPDGRFIAFLRQLSENETTLIVIPALGGRERALLTLQTSYILGSAKPAWSHDSKWLVISAAMPGRNQQALERVNIDSGQTSWITQPDPATGLNDVMPAIDPSGRQLAFSRVGGGYITAAFVLPVTDALEPAGNPKAIEGRVSALTPEWLNEDELIVATGGVHSTLWRLSGSGKAIQPIVVPGNDVVQPAIQATAHRLAYVSKTQDTNIWLLDLAGTTKTAKAPSRIINSTQSDVNPQVSPDGKRIAFSSNRSGKYDIWLWEADALDAFQLTTMDAGTTGSPRWSPNGREIAFDSNVGGRSNVYVINSDGGTPRKLTESSGANVIPCWSKDGKAIIFGSSRSGTFQIWKMNADGTQPVMITKNGGFAPLLSPDGAFIYYAKSPALASDIWRVPVAGGEERKMVDGVYRYSFALTPQGLYFVSAPRFQKSSSIRYLEFANNKVTDVFALADPPDLGLGISSDFQHLYFAKIDHSDSDIMLVENVH